MQELLPPQQAVFNQLKAQIADVFRLHGFQNIETPIIDRTDILLAKAGGDTEKQIYRVIKTKEAAEGADQALRFDHTVPLARYVVEHENDLNFPFKVSQIGRNFRGERAQKGRFREFYQCDIDVVGRGQLPVTYDAEVIATIYAALAKMQLPKMRIRLSNRKILAGFFEEYGLQAQAEKILSIIDHAEKVPREDTLAALEDLALDPEVKEKILTLMEINGDKQQVVTRLNELKVDNALYRQGVDELESVLEALEQNQLGGAVMADLLIVRGLDYYTGTVFETFLDDAPEIGSIASGGRYDNLTGFFSNHPFPGVGGSIGLTRLFYILCEHNLLKSQQKLPLDVAVVPMAKEQLGAAYQLADKLRKAGKATDVVQTGKRLGDKLDFAAKNADFAIVVGETEAQNGQYIVKNLTTREQLPLADFLSANS